MELEYEDDPRPWERVVGFAGPSFSGWACVAVTAGNTLAVANSLESQAPLPEESSTPAPGSDEPMQSSAGSETVFSVSNSSFQEIEPRALASGGTASTNQPQLFGRPLEQGMSEGATLREDHARPYTARRPSSDLTRDLRRDAQTTTPSPILGTPVPSTIDPSSEQARQLLLARANQVSTPASGSSSAASKPKAASRAGVAADPDKTLSPLTVSPSILIPDRAQAAARRASDCINQDHGRVLRRVPEPPAAPTAVTAPAVVQLLLASRAAATAEQLRAEQMAFCQRNNLKEAYECQERLRVVQAQLEQLEAHVDMTTTGSRRLDRSPRGTRLIPSHTNGADSEGHLASGRVCDWEGWYARPYCNIAAADYCAGLDEPSLIL